MSMPRDEHVTHEGDLRMDGYSKPRIAVRSRPLAPPDRRARRSIQTPAGAMRRSIDLALAPTAARSG